MPRQQRRAMCARRSDSAFSAFSGLTTKSYSRGTPSSFGEEHDEIVLEAARMALRVLVPRRGAVIVTTTSLPPSDSGTTGFAGYSHPAARHARMPRSIRPIMAEV